MVGGNECADCFPDPIHLVKTCNETHTTPVGTYDDTQCFGHFFGILVGFNLVLVSIASFLVVFVEPVAKGSGIAEIKCYLNGIKIKRLLRVKTLLAKVLGVTCSVAGGLACGKEGPMIHSGAVVAGGLSQGKSTTFDVTFIDNLYKPLRNDHIKREFISAGAAAGVAAAFGAPVGGVLFALEEGCSYWDQTVTWRTFVCGMVSFFTFNVMLSGVESNDWIQLKPSELVNLGRFEGTTTYNLAELPVFVLLGVIGGLAGALFNALNCKLTVLRMRFVKLRGIKYLEVLLVATLSTCAGALMVRYWGTCLPMPDEVEHTIELDSLFCSKDEYNDLAQVAFVPQGQAIKNLFHNTREISYKSLLGFTPLYFFVACVTYGINVPSGLFVPSLFTGALYGRLFGEILKGFDLDVNVGTYALVGAASMIGGIARMTISLTVIIIEATGNIYYALPIMIAIITAKWTGDRFNEGLYDIHIQLQKVEFLEQEAPQHMLSSQVKNVMSTEVEVLSPVETYGTLLAMLEISPHSAFPVARRVHGDTSSGLRCVGLILKTQILTILMERNTGNKEDAFDHHKYYPRFPGVDAIEPLTPEESMTDVDLTEHMNRAFYAIQETYSLSRAYRLFRTMGLRHLLIVDEDNLLKGIVTRRDLYLRLHNHHT